MDGTGALDRAVSMPGDLPEDEVFRAQLYGLLARMLAAAPEAALLQAVAAIRSDDTALGQAIHELARQASAISARTAEREYHDLFIGLGRGELVPFGSYYLAGFLNERPLAALRRALERLGIARAEGVKEPEDHIAALLEVMAGLITGAFGAPSPLPEQQAFFDAHIAPWASGFFADLERAKAAALYAALARVGRLFLEIETTAFAMA